MPVHPACGSGDLAGSSGYPICLPGQYTSMVFDDAAQHVVDVTHHINDFT